MRYSAFISYNSRDRATATWLHRALESFRIPRRMWGQASPLGPLGTRLPPVFKDREELGASADLAQSVRDALAVSSFLIVVCSPSSAASQWVNEEIRTFTALGRRERIFCLIIAGEPNASRKLGGDVALECLPPALFESGGREPMAADLRPTGDGRMLARLKLLAGLLGVPFDDLRNREQIRRNRRLVIAAAALGVGFVAMSGLAAAALLERNDAIRERDTATQKTLTAERTVDFVKSLFEVSDPSEAKGATITAREILDRGAARIDEGLSDQPSVKAELMTTLAEVYAGLGSYKEGEAILRRSMRMGGVAQGSVTREYVALGDAQSRAGEYGPAIQSYKTALTMATAGQDPRPDLQGRILDGLGEAASGLNAFAQADRLIHRALVTDMAGPGAESPDVARDLEALSVNDVFDNKLTEGRTYLDQALAIRRKRQGERHPLVSQDLMTLGSIAYLQHDSAAAEGYYRAALKTDRTVLGTDHPDVASLENNLARLLIERQDYASAKPLMEHSVAVISRERGETYDDLAFEFDNLALTYRGLGDLSAALPALQKALRAAQLHKSRNVAPILVDMADVRCAQHDARDGALLLEQARPVMAKAYPDDPWRLAWLDTVKGECLNASGASEAARNVLASNRPAITKRWPPGTLYNERSREFLARASR